MRFRMRPEGHYVSGDNYDEVVQAMADHKFEPVTSLEKYREATAERVHESFGFTIDTSTNELFVKALVHWGLMERG